MTKISNLYALTNYITANTSGNVVIVAPTSGTALYVTGSAQVTGQLTLGSTITNGTYTYTLPSATGTLALASSLGSYLPLAGGTMSGAIVGTTATFTNSGSGIGLGVTQSGSAGDGIKITHSAGRAFNILSSANGYGLIINNETIATSVPFTIQKQGADKIVFTDAGAGTFAGALSGASGSFNTSFSNTSDMQIVANGNISGINIRSSAGGRLSILQNFIAPNVTSFLTSTGTSNPSVEAIRIANGTGAAIFSSTINTGGDVDLGGGSYRSNGEIVARRSGNELRLGSGVGADYTVFYTGGAQKMTLDSSGRLGIGTTVLSATGSNLQVEQSGTPNIVAIRRGDSSNTGAARILWQAYNASSVIQNTAIIEAGLDSSSTLGYLALSAGTPSTAHLTIKSTGYVGIGTTTPGNNLQVDATVTGEVNLLRLQSPFGSGNNINLNFATNVSGTSFDVARIKMVNGGASNFGMSFSTYDAGGLTERMRITSDGNLLLGTTGNATGVRAYFYSNSTTSSSYPFATRNSAGTDTMYIRSDGYGYLLASAWAYGSDLRLKENVEYIGEGMSIISKLKPAKFDYINGVKSNIGWIAQDVQKVIPEAVSINSMDENNYLALKQEFIVPYLVKAVQELKAELDTLKNK